MGCDRALPLVNSSGGLMRSGGLTTYYHRAELSISATTRKPTNVASVCHQRLFGFCGSRRLHASSEPRRAALRSRGGSSSHEPPRTTCGYSADPGSLNGSDFGEAV